MNIVLFGFMGSGKSTVGRILAERLGWMFFDTDEMIQSQTRLTIPQIFREAGEDAFRTLESQAVRLVALMDRAVIATGGGVPLKEENMRELERNGATVLLEASPETILARLKEESASRPLLQGADPAVKVRELLASRREAYARARHRVATDGLSPEQVAERVLHATGAA